MKWFHAIGICGKATSNIALMFKRAGWFVTGSDLQFFPPASDFLSNNNIPVVEGYNYAHLNKDFWQTNAIINQFYKEEFAQLPEHPDLCLIVESASSQNKEYLYAKKLGVRVSPFAEILKDYFIKPNSIVVTGTAGKTTVTALITLILKNLDINPSYMVGAEVIDMPDSIQNTTSSWSVTEGDEFFSRELSTGAKFLKFNPKYLVITSLGWEHQDVYPTKELYLDEFKKAVQMVPIDGVVLAPDNVSEIDYVLSGFTDKKIVRYKYSDTKKTGVWSIFKENDSLNVCDLAGKSYITLTASLLGKYNVENICGVVALIDFLAVDLIKTNSNLTLPKIKEVVAATIKDFKGPKKRIEILKKTQNTMVIDDFAVAPDRIKNTLQTLAENFPEYKIVTVFEPNSGSRPKDVSTLKNLYQNSFFQSELVILPELSTLNQNLATEFEIVKSLKEMNINAINIPAKEIEQFLLKHRKGSLDKNIYLFCSSYRLTSIANKFALTI